MSARSMPSGAALRAQSRGLGLAVRHRLSHYGKEPDFSDASQVKFRAWLKAKYGTVEALNRDWGNAFWSQMYQN